MTEKEHSVYIVTWALEVQPIPQYYVEKFVEHNEGVRSFRIAFATEQEAYRFIAEVQRFTGDAFLAFRDMARDGIGVNMKPLRRTE